VVSSTKDGQTWGKFAVKFYIVFIINMFKGKKVLLIRPELVRQFSSNQYHLHGHYFTECIYSS